jgi:hypothetical protein
MTDLSYCVLRPHEPTCRERARLERAYACWQKVWSAMLSDLDGTELKFSDDFTRQDEIGALFLGDDCVGLSGYRWLDLSLSLARKDSYFAPWPPELLDEIAAQTPRVCIGSNLVVSAPFRDLLAPLKLGEVLLALAVRRFKESAAQIMLGTMRNNRAMNSHAYRFGARPLQTNVMSHNVPVDLVAFERDAACSINLPPIIWVRPSFFAEDQVDDENTGRLRRAAG